MYYLYILRSETTNQYYVGSTGDISKRVKEHNTGKSVYTKNKGPWTLMYQETYNTLGEARRREKQIKAWKKRAAIERLITKSGPIV